MGFTWTVPPSEVFPQGYQAYIQALEQVGVQIGEARSPEITEWMKQNHPWQNRTGAAEAGLTTTPRQDMPAILLELTMSHGVSYGIYLETIGAGKWAIIAPAVDYFGPRIVEDFRAALGFHDFSAP
jgi:hypothetical protein